MRAIGIALVGTLAFATADALAADVRSGSEIVSVIVFPSGAEVTRLAKVRLEPGEHALLLTDLPALAVPGSIRVEGKATGRLEIGAVDTRRLRVPRADPVQQASERRAIELEIEKLKDERAIVETEIKASETQLALVGKLTELPEHPAPAGQHGAAAQPDWGQLFALIGQRSTEAQRASLAASVKIRDIDRRIEDLQKKLAALAPTQDERTEVKVALAAGSALDAELSIRYQVGGASWVPYYDARLATGTKDAAPSLKLSRRASVQQRTGEDWRDVALQLSTTRPGAGTSAPELSPMIVDFEPDYSPPRPMAPAPAPMARSARPAAEADAEKATAGAALKMEAASERQAKVEAAPFQAIFSVPGKLTVMATGEQKRVQIDDADIEPQLAVRTVPRIDPKAYLYAKLIMPKTTAYLPGQVSLFRDGTFVGNGRLPLLAPGEQHELGFGADDAVRVRHSVLEEKRSEQGIISSSKADQRSYRITVRNMHQRAIGVVVMDQIPVSQHQDIKVELTGKQSPSRRDIEDKRGTLAWDLKLEPDQEALVEFGWRIQWPAARKIQISP
jgi:uncharacterized protein (TIGR02231 family)